MLSLDADKLETPVARDTAMSLPCSVIENRPAQPPRSVLTHASPRRPGRALWSVPVGGAEDVAQASGSARREWRAWARTDRSERADVLACLAERLEAAADRLARQLAEEIGKPVTQARGEVLRS